MNAPTDQRRIALPQWYAAFSPGALHGGRRPGTRDGAGLQFGPITIFRADEGCTYAPLHAAPDAGVAIVDGYIFDGRTLRRELGLAAEATDGALVAAAYSRWGLELFDRLDGSYLIAIWDPGTGRFVLGHDSLGHHPVFFSDRPDCLWFTSNVLALPAAGAVDRTPNRVSLAMATLLYWPAAGETFFEQVRRLGAGRYLTADTRLGLHEVNYFSPYLADDEPELTEKEAWERFEPTLLAAIGRSMELQPDSIMLSGGLDSVTIAALAMEYSRDHGTPPIAAISGRRDFPPSVEEPMQVATAQALGMRHIAEKESAWMQGRTNYELSLDVVSLLPGPSRVYWVGGYMAFYRFAVAHGLRVALTGSGGDNWVSVLDAFAAHSLRHLRFDDAIRHMRSWMGTGGLTFRRAALHLLWSGGIRLLLDSYGARLTPSLKEWYHRKRALEAQPSWVCPDRVLREALADTLYRQRPAALTDQGRVPGNFYRHAARSVKNPYYLYEYEVAFHVDATCGLRLLSPYHDREVVRFLNRIPPRVLLAGDSYKGMLRPLAKKRLPSLGLEAQRKVYGSGVQETEEQNLRTSVLDGWSRQSLTRLADLGVVDVSGARQALNPAQTTDFGDLVTMQALASAEGWVSAHTA